MRSLRCTTRRYARITTTSLWRRRLQKTHLRVEDQVVKYKKYFYALRPLLAARWVREFGTVPPMRFAELATALLSDAALLDELNALLEKKMRAGEAATSAPWPGVQAFLEKELADAMNFAPAPSGDKVPATAANTYLREAVMHFSKSSTRKGEP